MSKYHKPKKKCATKFCRNNKAKYRTICHKCHMRNWRKNHPEKSAYHAIRHHATQRRIEFQLTFDEFMEVIAGTGYIEQKGSRRHELQIDRIRAHLPYSFDNVCVITCGENAHKSNWERHTPRHKRHMLERGGQEPEEDCPF